VKETILVGGSPSSPASCSIRVHRLLVRFGARQHVASYSPASHRAKEGTPTLGGVLFCLVVLIAWIAVDRSREGFVAIFALLAGAIAGGLDDIVNINDVSRLGLSVYQKLGLQGVAGVLVGVGLTIAGFTNQFFPGSARPTSAGVSPSWRPSRSSPPATPSTDRRRRRARRIVHDARAHRPRHHRGGPRRPHAAVIAAALAGASRSFSALQLVSRRASSWAMPGRWHSAA